MCLAPLFWGFVCRKDLPGLETKIPNLVLPAHQVSIRFCRFSLARWPAGGGWSAEARRNPLTLFERVWARSKRDSSDTNNEPSEPRDLAGVCSGQRFRNEDC